MYREINANIIRIVEDPTNLITAPLSSSAVLGLKKLRNPKNYLVYRFL